MTRAKVAARVAGCAAFISLGTLIIWHQGAVRRSEAALAGDWFGVLLHGWVGARGDVIYFAWSGGGPLVGLQISLGCTVALLLGPLCALAAVLLVLTRASWFRCLAGLAVGLTIAVVVNQVRLAVVAFCTQRWGLAGFDAGHEFVGTIVAIAGFVAAATLMVKVVLSPGRRDAGVA